MIVVTGASGFIGSCLIQKFNQEGFNSDVVVVDDFYKDYKDPNLDHKFICDWTHRDFIYSRVQESAWEYKFCVPSRCQNRYFRNQL